MGIDGKPGKVCQYIHLLDLLFFQNKLPSFDSTLLTIFESLPLILTAITPHEYTCPL